MSLPFQRPDWRALAAGAGLLGLAAVVSLDARNLGGSATYGIGPDVVPYIVSGFLALLAVGHFVAAFRGGLPKAEPADYRAIVWIGVGLVGLIACIGFGGGFVPATTALFVTTARALGRKALLVDALIGLALGVAIYLLFAKLLTLSLPMGPLERLL
jgi:putative tricarboxylic transport membrane protein